MKLNGKFAFLQASPLFEICVCSHFCSKPIGNFSTPPPYAVVESWHPWSPPTKQICFLWNAERWFDQLKIFSFLFFFGMCSFSGKLWSIFKISVRGSSGKASKIMEIRIPIQITDNFKSSLYAFLVLLYSAFIRHSFYSIFGSLYLESAHSNKELQMLD